MLKTCSKCGIEKPEIQFRRGRNQCKACLKIIRQIYTQSEKGKSVIKAYQQSDNYKSYRMEYDKLYKKSESGKAVIKTNRQSQQGKETLKRYRQSDKAKAYKKKYQQSEKYKVLRKKYRQSEASIDAHNRYFHKRRLIEVTGAIPSDDLVEAMVLQSKIRREVKRMENES
ncbi:hypothetical protein [Burkholderia anthina]|uniref:hypothetical protein n=1 Tax=Burkholderia anthina TaxID=179879 RepID=UPI001AA036CC|nr:hypothetical protein [Burkholderia anthina]QTD88915.1 hypothetical protein J4G50_13970 [Burkholderia anthina]